MRYKIGWIGLILILLISLSPKFVLANDKYQNLSDLNPFIQKAIISAKQGDLTSAKTQFQQFRSAWLQVEDGVKKASEQAYHDIEDQMGQVQFAFAQEPVQIVKVLAKLNQLEQVNNQFINGKYKGTQGQIKANSNQNIAYLVELLHQALNHLQHNDAKSAAANIDQFRKQWLDIEGVVLTKSKQTYLNTEDQMVTAYALLTASNPDVVGAQKTIQIMIEELTPFVQKTNYTMFDATTILLREGLEALLVVVALLAFLRKAGYADKQKWIWYGVGVGLFFSILLGIVVKLLFSSGAFGHNNFLISGYTGLFAALMLIYMSYWLHSKSKISHWKRYIRNKSTKALATGSLWSLAVLAFLAIFREGTETAIFLIGMASSITLWSLLSGIAIGLAILVVIAFLLLKVGLKIPIRPFFIISSGFVFYLGFKFTGMGVHGLQLAGVIPATHINGMLTINFLAIYATWESILTQAVLLLFVLLFWFIRSIRVSKEAAK